MNGIENAEDSLPEETSQNPWEEYEDGDGVTYFFNSVTGETSWTNPTAIDTITKIEEPDGTWVEYWDEEYGASYWWNTKTEETRWDNPTVVDSTGYDSEYGYDTGGENVAGDYNMNELDAGDYSGYDTNLEGEYNDIDSHANYESYGDTTSEQGNDLAENIGWNKYFDEEGYEYYFNNETGETMWEPPEDWIDMSNENNTIQDEQIEKHNETFEMYEQNSDKERQDVTIDPEEQARRELEAKLLLEKNEKEQENRAREQLTVARKALAEAESLNRSNAVRKLRGKAFAVIGANRYEQNEGRVKGARCAECNCSLIQTSRGKAYSIDNLETLLETVGKMGKWSSEVKKKVNDRFEVCKIKDIVELREYILTKRLNSYMKAKGQKPFGKKAYSVLKSLALKMEFRFIKEYEIQYKNCSVKDCKRRVCSKCINAITGSWEDMPWICQQCDESHKIHLIPLNNRREKLNEEYRLKKEKVQEEEKKRENREARRAKLKEKRRLEREEEENSENDIDYENAPIIGVSGRRRHRKRKKEDNLTIRSAPPPPPRPTSAQIRNEAAAEAREKAEKELELEAERLIQEQSSMLSEYVPFVDPTLNKYAFNACKEVLAIAAASALAATKEVDGNVRSVVKLVSQMSATRSVALAHVAKLQAENDFDLNKFFCGLLSHHLLDLVKPLTKSETDILHKPPKLMSVTPASRIGKKVDETGYWVLEEEIQEVKEGISKGIHSLWEKLQDKLGRVAFIEGARNIWAEWQAGGNVDIKVKMHEKLRKHVKSLFDGIDDDKSGKIDKREMTLLIRGLGLPKVTTKTINSEYKIIDSDGSGGVTFEEFFEWLEATRNRKTCRGPVQLMMYKKQLIHRIFERICFNMSLSKVVNSEATRIRKLAIDRYRLLHNQQKPADPGKDAMSRFAQSGKGDDASHMKLLRVVWHFEEFQDTSTKNRYFYFNSVTKRGYWVGVKMPISIAAHGTMISLKEVNDGLHYCPLPQRWLFGQELGLLQRQEKAYRSLWHSKQGREKLKERSRRAKAKGNIEREYKRLRVCIKRELLSWGALLKYSKETADLSKEKRCDGWSEYTIIKPKIKIKENDIHDEDNWFDVISKDGLLKDPYRAGKSVFGKYKPFLVDRNIFYVRRITNSYQWDHPKVKRKNHKYFPDSFNFEKKVNMMRQMEEDKIKQWEEQIATTEREEMERRLMADEDVLVKKLQQTFLEIPENLEMNKQNLFLREFTTLRNLCDAHGRRELSRFQWLTTLKSSHHGRTHKVLQASTGRVCILKEVRAPRKQVKAAIKAIEATLLYGADCLINVIDLWDVPYNEDIGQNQRWHHLFVAMEFASGGSLEDRIDSRWSDEKSLELALDVCQGLHSMHQCGLPHGKLTPQCVFFDRRGRVKLANFRIIRMAGHRRAEAEPTSGGRSLNLAYKEDIRAMALVVYRAVTGSRGRKHFTANLSTPLGIVRNVPRSIPEKLKELMRRASHEDPNERPTTSECIKILGYKPKPRLHNKEFEKIAELAGGNSNLSDQDSISEDEDDAPWHRTRTALRGSAFMALKKIKGLDSEAKNKKDKNLEIKKKKLDRMQKARTLAGGIL